MEFRLRGDLQKTASEDLIELPFSTKRVNLHVCDMCVRGGIWSSKERGSSDPMKIA